MFYSATRDDILAVTQSIQGLELSDSSGLAQQNSSNKAVPVLAIDTPLCRATIAIQGAQLLSFERKRDNKPLIWCSPNALFKQGKAVRGGIPVCFPWFGAHKTDSSKPNHGFVRDHDWKLANASYNERDELQLSFTFSNDENTLALYPHEFKATLEFTLGDKIDIRFHVSNLSSSDMPCSWALHSYLPVQDLSSTRVEGLDGCNYLNTVGTPRQEVQSGAVTFNGEVDRVYAQVGSVQTICEQSPLIIQGKNCPTAIVWNPGTELASTMGDLGAAASKEFICVERGAAFTDAWIIGKGQSKEALVSISAD